MIFHIFFILQKIVEIFGDTEKAIFPGKYRMTSEMLKHELNTNAVMLNKLFNKCTHSVILTELLYSPVVVVHKL